VLGQTTARTDSGWGSLGGARSPGWERLNGTNKRSNEWENEETKARGAGPAFGRARQPRNSISSLAASSNPGGHRRGATGLGDGLLEAPGGGQLPGRGKGAGRSTTELPLAGHPTTTSFRFNPAGGGTKRDPNRGRLQDRRIVNGNPAVASSGGEFLSLVIVAGTHSRFPTSGCYQMNARPTLLNRKWGSSEPVHLAH